MPYKNRKDRLESKRRSHIKCSKHEREYLKKYRKKNRKKILYQKKIYARLNRPKILKKQKRYRELNWLKLKKRRRAYYLNITESKYVIWLERQRRWRKSHRNEINNYKKKYYIKQNQLIKRDCFFCGKTIKVNRNKKSTPDCKIFCSDRCKINNINSKKIKFDNRPRCKKCGNLIVYNKKLKTYFCSQECYALEQTSKHKLSVYNFVKSTFGTTDIHKELYKFCSTLTTFKKEVLDAAS